MTEGEAKRETNLRKHGLDFIDACLVLESEYVLIVDSPRGGQMRQQAFAYVFDVLAVLSMAFVAGEERFRIICFRPADQTERRTYYEWLKNYNDDQL